MKIRKNPIARSLSLKLAACLALTALHGTTALAATFYVAPTGSDSNAGTQAAPFKSITKAQSVASSGDTVYLRGGTYNSFSIASSDSHYNYVHAISKSGISYLAFTGETPVFDFSSVAASKRVCAFRDRIQQHVQRISGDRRSRSAPRSSRRVSGSTAAAAISFGALKVHDCPAIGFYIQKTASNTLVENCDAYNWSASSGVSAGNIDGFGCHSSGAATSSATAARGTTATTATIASTPPAPSPSTIAGPTTTA